MNNFLLYSLTARIAINLLLVISVVAATITLILGFFRHPLNRLRLLENLTDSAVFIQVMLYGMLFARHWLAMNDALPLPLDYGIARNLTALVLCLGTLFSSLAKRSWLSLAAVPGAILALPFFELTAGTRYGALYLTALLILLLRSVIAGVAHINDLSHNLSGYTIKNAIDSLHTGVIFAETEGYILLVNEQMQRLMLLLTGTMQRNYHEFYTLIESGYVREGFRREELEGRIVYLLPDATAWMFTSDTISIAHRYYLQLTATDVTRRWQLVSELREQDKALTERNAELSCVLADLQSISHLEETHRVRMHAHDVLGQRLSLLLNHIRSHEDVDAAFLQSISRSLLEDLREAPALPTPQEALDSLIAICAAVGIEIVISGYLPQETASGNLCIEIIREAVTNAIHHGYATKIEVEISQGESALLLHISNNGLLPSDELFREGGGLSGIRYKLLPLGGSLSIQISPVFSLTVCLSGDKPS